MLMSTGLTRPPDQLEYWDSLIHRAIKGGITFYGLDVHGLDNDTDPMAGSIALLHKTAELSRGQSSVGLGAGQETARAGRGVNIGGSQAAQIMESMHQTDYLRFGVLSANTQEALRELADSTGGFLIANTNNTGKLARVMEDVDTHYEISYRPTSEREDGHFRKIEVKLAKADLRVQTRGGYFAVPDRPGDPLTGADMAGLRALDAKPLPRAFSFESRALRFRTGNGLTQYAIAFQVPIANLTATPEKVQQKHRFHASLFALVKNADGEIVDRVSRDVPSEILDSSLPGLRTESMTYEHAVSLAPGRYTIETAVVDHEGARASTNILQIDNPAQQAGPGLSDIVFVHRIQELQRPPDASDPFEIPGKRATPFLGTTLAPVVKPLVYFIVYPEKKSGAKPTLRAEFLKNGRILTSQKTVLPPPNSLDEIPLTLEATEKPGDYEVRITVEQGRRTIQRSLKYAIAMK